jgi:hypothetical protein
MYCIYNPICMYCSVNKGQTSVKSNNMKKTSYAVELSLLNDAGSSCRDEVENLYSISEQLGLQPQCATVSLSSLSVKIICSGSTFTHLFFKCYFMIHLISYYNCTPPLHNCLAIGKITQMKDKKWPNWITFQILVCIARQCKNYFLNQVSFKCLSF